ncbi:MAG: cobalamin B12-binding domain-containing protein [Eubacteriales bacterium]
MAVRFLLGKIGIDGHDRGARVISYGLRRAGFEVIYTGPWQSVDSIIETAIQEDVDIIGISTLGGDYVLMPRLMERMRQRGLDLPVILGGTIPDDEEESLKQAGVSAVFRPGSSMESIVSTINSLVRSTYNVTAGGAENERQD